ncbi:MAG: hypothetical protein QNJ68_02600 [Microcoleaceae cyanobacterium MO_207.B10]|nr:hypothetical protein [Microcoleaceae cyanobacterium MO_207.B10]
MPNINFSDFTSQKFRPSKKARGWRWTYLAAIQIFTSSLLVGIPPKAMAQANRQSFVICSRELLSVGLSESEVTNACSAALKPRGLSGCVTKIYDNTTEALSAEEILFNCQQVRRVDELGTCVEKINKAVKGALNQAAVLEGCRRSLLPERFSSCVVGVNRNVGLPTEDLLATCLNPNEEINQISPQQES